MAPEQRKVLIRNGPITHVSIRTVMELEQVLLHEWGMASQPEWRWDLLRKALYRSGRTVPGFFRLLEARKHDHELFFAVLMGVEHIRKAFPFFHRRARRKGLYVFDCWPSKTLRMAREVRRYGIDPLFLSSGQAAKRMREALPEHPRIVHVPEGIEPSPYKPRPYEEKDIELLQFGRKHPSYHEKLLQGLPEAEKRYLYEKEKGKLVFPDMDTFIEGLGRTRISICFPSSMTDPERSGGDSTLTQRYLQSMASKCLVVGAMPEDAKGILPKDALIEADMERPAEQIEEILANFDQYIPLIERNYEEVVKVQTWKERASRMAPYLFPEG